MFGIRAYRRLVEQVDETNQLLVRTLSRIDDRLGLNNKILERNTRAFERFERSHDDMRDQLRANTQAILRLLDRLGGNQNPA